MHTNDPDVRRPAPGTLEPGCVAVKKGRLARLAAAPALALAILSAAGSGCAHVTNFLDPAGPRYDEALAPPVDSAACSGHASALTAVTFNIEHSRKIDEAIDVLRSAPQLKDADVLLLQEMNPPAVARIAAALSMNSLHFPSGVHPQSKQEFGTAVLSRWAIEDARKIVLPHAAFITNLRRAVTQATLRCGERRIVAMSLHLSAPLALSYEDRQEQVESILEHAKSIADPLIVAGDFNARWVGELFEKAGFDWLSKALPGTASGLGMRLKYDHVFARGFKPAPGGPSAGVGDAKGSSDHHPMWVRLQFPPAP